MAFGFHPHHKETFTYSNLTHEQLLVLSVAVAQELNWSVSYVHDKGFSAHTRIANNAIGEDISLQIDGENVTLMSESHLPQERQFEQNKSNLQDFVKQLYTVQQLATPEFIAEKTETLNVLKKFKTEAHQSSRKDFHDPSEKFDSIWSFAIPSKDYFATPLLIYANLLVFILMVINGVHIFEPDPESLVAWGGNFRPVTLDDEPWRLLTSCFLHGGIFHLAMNMYALWYIGVLLEPLLGTVRFSLAYLLAGIGASMTSLYWHDYTVCVGASGAIFGMYGVFIAFLTTNLLEKEFRNFMMSSMGIYVAYNLFYGFTNKGIDNAAHIGGLLTGAIIGYALYFRLKKGEYEKLARPFEILIVLLIVGGSALVYLNLDNDLYVYDKKMKAFSELERKAISSRYDTTKVKVDKEIVDNIKTIGIPAWKESITLLNEIDELDLPERLKERNKDLHRYVELRLKNYELTEKAYLEITDAYNEEINANDIEIYKILEKLNGESETE